MENALSTLLTHVEAWAPKEQAGWGENDYRDELKRWLGDRIGGVPVSVAKSKYLSNGLRRPDLRIRFCTSSSGRLKLEDGRSDEVVYVEMKLNLQTPRELTRLKRQIEDILGVTERPLRRLLVLLVGSTKQEFVPDLEALEKIYVLAVPTDPSSERSQLVVSRRLRVRFAEFRGSPARVDRA